MPLLDSWKLAMQAERKAPHTIDSYVRGEPAVLPAERGGVVEVPALRLGRKDHGVGLVAGRPRFQLGPGRWSRQRPRFRLVGHGNHYVKEFARRR